MGDHARRNVIMTAAIAGLGGLLFGYDTGIIASAMLFIRSDLGLSSFEQGVVVAAVPIGAAFGALAAGPMADRYGRKLVIIVSDDEEGDVGMTRPLLAEEQRTPSGVLRRHPIPMVMVGGGEEAYRRLATGGIVRAGMSRKYGVESDGRRISNVVIDDGEIKRPG